MAEIVPTTFPPDGATITMGAAASGDTAKTGSDLLLLVRNDSESPVNVTIAVPGNTVTGEAMPDNVISVAAGAMKGIPLLRVYRDPETRLAAISWGSTTDVTRAVLKV